MAGVLGYIKTMPYHVEILGTIAAIIAAWIATLLARTIIHQTSGDSREHYRRQKFVTTVLALLVADP